MIRRVLICLGVVLAMVWLMTPAAAAQEPDRPPIVADASLETGEWVSANRVASRSVHRPGQRAGAFVAKVLVPSRGRVRLKGKSRRVAVSPRTSWSRQATVLLVLGSVTYKGRSWLRLRLPGRPTGSSAWFRQDRMLIRKVPYWVRVRTKKRTVTVYRGGRQIARFRAVVGAPETPTPRGLGAVYERNRQPDPSEFLGPWAISLTFTSNILKNYGGGPGRVAIHGRSGASLSDPLGSAASHGCVRINNGRVSWLARSLPKGTPVRITG